MSLERFQWNTRIYRNVSGGKDRNQGDLNRSAEVRRNEAEGQSQETNPQTRSKFRTSITRV